jgi:hypothetical protein
VNKEQLINAFSQLGKIMTHIGHDLPWQGYEIGLTENEHFEFNETIKRQIFHNGWFTEELVRKSILNLGIWLNKESLSEWLKSYDFNINPKNIAVIMAGNIPLVGFHDFLCVLASGNRILCKLSSEDMQLLPLISKHLIQIEPEFEKLIAFSDRNLKDFDAVIATGSNNSLLHFEQYFSKHPHLFRHNRTSVAILNGEETKEELTLLGNDILDYFGRGCRNVSHLILPNGFDLNRFFEAIVDQGEVINNKKYGNNYDYNKAIHLMNQAVFLDNNFLLLKESMDLFSPLAMIHYHFYNDYNKLNEYLGLNKESIQCLIGRNYIPFGQGQCPKLNDYADGIDTMNWLSGLNM